MTACGLAVCSVSSSALAQSSAVAPLQSVQVLAVNNGQELLVEIEGQGRTLRLSCLQAPRPQQQPWAEQATVALVQEAPVGSRWQFQLRARDVYGRLVGTLQRNGQDLAAPLLRQGHVFAYDGFLGRCDDLPYTRWQEEAESQRLGVWSVPGGISRPWDQREQTAAADRLAP
jgi:micrococcal nuclease